MSCVHELFIDGEKISFSDNVKFCVYKLPNIVTVGNSQTYLPKLLEDVNITGGLELIWQICGDFCTDL